MAPENRRTASRRLFLFSLFTVGIGCVPLRLHVRFFAGLNCMFCAWSDLLTAVFFFLLDFFVVGNVAWVCHLTRSNNSPKPDQQENPRRQRKHR